MAGIQGIPGIITPTGTDPVSDRPSKRTEARTNSGQLDRVSISSEAQDAADVAKLAAASKDSEVRQQRVEQARKSIEEGTYRVQSVVLMVAARVSQYLN